MGNKVLPRVVGWWDAMDVMDGGAGMGRRVKGDRVEGSAR